MFIPPANFTKYQVSFNKDAFVRMLIYFQDYCGLEANVYATQLIKEYELEDLHQKITGNPPESYKKD
jgi:hypothetical protein